MKWDANAMQLARTRRDICRARLGGKFLVVVVVAFSKPSVVCGDKKNIK